ncbi:MAG: transcriptional regulator [Mycobacterium sp.]|nr:transcriptional regulator [Mycobacterium sp.]
MAPQGRPRKFDEDQVLSAAMEVFWEHGFEAATLAQLREATRLSSASLYGAFGSKSELFERAVAHYVRGPGRVTDLADDTTSSAAESLSRMLRASIDMQSDPTHPQGCLITLSATIGASSDEARAARAAASRRRHADRLRITDCVRRGQQDGEFPKDVDVEATASLIHTFLLGVSTQLRDGVPAEQLRRAADTLIRRLSTATQVL